jgi:hypothetical protein
MHERSDTAAVDPAPQAPHRRRLERFVVGTAACG